MKHTAAVATIACAAALDALGGAVFAVTENIPVTSGLYWAIATATTVGYGDITPHTPAGRAIAVAVMLTVIPLFGATFSLFTSGLAAVHIDSLGTGLHERLERIEHSHRQIRNHLGIHDGLSLGTGTAPHGPHTAPARRMGQQRGLLARLP